ncbi:MAG TPA: hypothetical protein VM686_11295 [Polyangiaceae bacterium]|nr:hypothetical protein [Polyangiaceae bacterium]
MKLRAAALLGMLAWWLPAAALADRAPLTLLPVSTPEPAEGEAQKPLARQAEILSDVLADAAYDQGFELKAPEGSAEQKPLDDDWLVDKARAGWVVSPRLEQSGNKIVVRLVAVAPGSRVLLVRSERMEPSLIEVRSMTTPRTSIRFESIRSLRSSSTREPGATATSLTTILLPLCSSRGDTTQPARALSTSQSSSSGFCSAVPSGALSSKP